MLLFIIYNLQQYKYLGKPKFNIITCINYKLKKVKVLKYDKKIKPMPKTTW